MPAVKRIVCLANSRKLNGRCVAGIEIADGQRLGWIRPVSARQRQEVSQDEQQYVDGTEPHVLDVMTVPLLDPVPRDHQQENWLLDPAQSWTREASMPVGDLERLVDPIEPLWINGYHTGRGIHDRVPWDQAMALRSSLRLIHTEHVQLSVLTTGGRFGPPRRQVRGWFRHQGRDYCLSVTDPEYERQYRARPEGNYEIQESFLTVSLGDRFEEQDACFKLIAAIMERREDDG